MKRWATRIGLGLLALVVIGLLGTTIWHRTLSSREHERVPPPGMLVDIGGFRLHILCEGEGSPTVVMDAGLGGWSTDWGKVLSPASKVTRVCAYDRAGMGWSDDGPLPRTSETIVAELHRLLVNMGIRGPLVLVGHSFGGYNVRLYAAKYPKDVAGMVLVDASHEDQDERLPAEMTRESFGQRLQYRLAPFAAQLGLLRLAGIGMGPDPEKLAPWAREDAGQIRFWSGGYRAALSELQSFPTSASQLRAVDRRLEMPLVVLSAGKQEAMPGMPPEMMATMRAVWDTLQREEAALSPQGVRIIATESPHYISLTQPDLVVDAIRNVVETVRRTDGQTVGR